MLTLETVGAPIVEPHYKVAKVAELLDVGRDWVYDRIRDGVFTVVELGEGRGNQRIPASEVNRFLAERTIPGGIAQSITPITVGGDPAG